MQSVSVYDLASEPDTYGCRLWSGRLNQNGYGKHERTLAHIASYIEARGAIPDGMVVDHLCRRRACVRLAHLELVTQSQNMHRKKWGVRVRRERCAQGHLLSEWSVVIPETGGFVCRRCNQEES